MQIMYIFGALEILHLENAIAEWDFLPQSSIASFSTKFFALN